MEIKKISDEVTRFIMPVIDKENRGKERYTSTTEAIMLEAIDKVMSAISIENYIEGLVYTDATKKIKTFNPEKHRYVSEYFKKFGLEASNITVSRISEAKKCWYLYNLQLEFEINAKTVLVNQIFDFLKMLLIWGIAKPKMKFFIEEYKRYYIIKDGKNFVLGMYAHHNDVFSKAYKSVVYENGVYTIKNIEE